MARKDKLNVILIVLDAVRFDHLSCYGYQRATSPRIDSIAAQGHTFLNAISAAPGTLSSMPSIMTGRYVSEHGVGPLNRRLGDDFVTMAEWLQQRGYLTAGFSNNAWISEATGLSRGFSTFRQTSRFFSHEQSPSKVYVGIERLYRLLISERYDSGDRRTIHESVKWIRSILEEEAPFFLFVHLLEAHAPYDPPNPYYGMFLPDDMEPKRRSSIGRMFGRIQDSLSRFHAVPKTPAEREAITLLYDGSIRYLDDLVGDFYQWLGEAGVLEDTLLVITADHGENLGDHGLLGHGACLYETLIHVPLVCIHPTLFPSAQPVAALVQASDVFPTVVDILGGDERLRFDSVGRSLLPHRVQAAPRSAVFSEDPRYGSEHLINTGLDPDAYNRALSAVRTHTWKYIAGSDGGEELYNLEKDPNEQYNLVDSEIEQVLSLREVLRSWQAGLQGFDGESEQIEFDDIIVERLRDLGYIA